MLEQVGVGAVCAVAPIREIIYLKLKGAPCRGAEREYTQAVKAARRLCGLSEYLQTILRVVAVK
jgi:hypothetical protein